jgi:hypothetical protein
MEKFSQKYTIINLLEDIPEGAAFASSNWPLHVTLAGTFAVELDDDLRHDLATLTADCPPIITTAAHDEHFGPEQQTDVTTLNMNSELVTFHNSVIKLLKKAGAMFNDPQYIEDGYRAHVTVQRHGRLHAGDLVTIDNLTIVDMFPGNDPYRRRVLNTSRLSGRADATELHQQ